VAILPSSDQLFNVVTRDPNRAKTWRVDRDEVS
jgi:hypothetical protein